MQKSFPSFFSLHLCLLYHYSRVISQIDETWHEKESRDDTFFSLSARFKCSKNVFKSEKDKEKLLLGF